MSVTLAIDPFNEDEAIRLYATVISHASYPITILTWSTFLDLRDAQTRKVTGRNFHCVDLDNGTPLRLQNRICGLRLPIRHRLDHDDSEYFHTLRPEEPHTICGPCLVRHHKLVPGHRYRFHVDDNQVITWWRQGIKEDVLARPGQELPGHMLHPSGGPITLTEISPVEVTVPLDWENISASGGADVTAIGGPAQISRGSTPPPLITTRLLLNRSTNATSSVAELSILLTSHAKTPITIWIWATILNMNVVQWRDGFTLTHLDTDTLIPAKEMFCLVQDGLVPTRDRNFHTLLPGENYKLSAIFTPVTMKELESRPGRYRLAASGTTNIKWWKEGIREELIAPIGQPPFDNMYEASGEPITLTVDPIEFTIPARP